MRESRRTFVGGLAAAAGVAAAGVAFNINHAWSRDVRYDGGTFDAGGAVLRFGCWPGGFKRLLREFVIDPFEKDFNCTVVYDDLFPWAPRVMASGPRNTPIGLNCWNLPEMFKVALSGDYFVEQQEVIENVPAIKNCWPFSLSNGVGVTWLYSRLCHAYVTDREPPPTDFKSFWDSRYEGHRLLLGRENDIFKGFFLTAAKEFGTSQRDLDAALEAMRPLAQSGRVHFSHEVTEGLTNGKGWIGINIDLEVYAQMDKGVPMAPLLWEARTIITQNLTVARYRPPMERKLAYALMNRLLGRDAQSIVIANFPQGPGNADVEVPERWARFGLRNTLDATDNLWIPNWVWWHENATEIERRLKDIFGA